jgi:hypothetical protein
VILIGFELRDTNSLLQVMMKCGSKPVCKTEQHKHDHKRDHKRKSRCASIKIEKASGKATETIRVCRAGGGKQQVQVVVFVFVRVIWIRRAVRP